MRSFFVAACCLLAPGAAGAQTDGASESFKLVTTLHTEQGDVRAEIYFHGTSAVEFEDTVDGKPAVIYDLTDGSWRDFSPPRVVTQADYEAWGKASFERTKASAAKAVSVDLRQFIEETLEPKFTVTAEENRLLLAGKILHYDIRTTAAFDKAKRERFYAYDKINAYRKAMIDRKLPPFAQLAVSRELATRDVTPTEMKVEIRTPQQTIRLETKIEVIELSAAEQTRVAAVVAEQAGR
jgi:hypothetical protein